MVLNDNVNLEGELFIENSEGGITFYDGSRQTTASPPSWHQIIPAARFEKVLNEGAVLDRETGLVWEIDTVDTTYTWDGAVMRCYKLNIGGRKGWRLPTISELMTLVEPLNSSPATQKNIFINIKCGLVEGERDGYWTSTNKLNDPTKAMFVRFSNGDLMINTKATDYYVRAVRSAE